MLVGRVLRHDGKDEVSAPGIRPNVRLLFLPSSDSVPLQENVEQFCLIRHPLLRELSKMVACGVAGHDPNALGVPLTDEHVSPAQSFHFDIVSGEADLCCMRSASPPFRRAANAKDT